MSHRGIVHRGLSLVAAAVSVAGLVQIAQAAPGNAAAPVSTVAKAPVKASVKASAKTQSARPAATTRTVTPKAVVCSGTAALGSTKTCVLPSGGGTAQYTFTVPAADTVRFRASVAAGSYERTMTVSDASDTVLCTANGIGVRDCAVPAAGTYRLDVSMTNGVTVQTSIDTVSHATCGSALDLAVGSAGVPVDIPVAGTSWCAAIDAAPGDVLEFGLDTNGDQVLDLAAYSASGERVCDVPFSSSYGRTFCTITGGSAVRLFATPDDDVAQSAVLLVSRVSTPVGCTARGVDAFAAAPNHHAALPEHGQRCYSLTAPSNNLGIHLLAVGAVPNFSLGWSVRSADGVAVCTGYPDNLAALLDPAVDACHVVAGGTYTVFVTSQARVPTRFTAGVFDLAATAGCTPVADTSWGATAAALTLPVAAQANCYSVGSPAGSAPVLRVIIDDARRDTARASVVNSAGRVICVVRASNDCALADPGTYRVLVYAAATDPVDVDYWVVDTSSTVGCDTTTADAMGTAPARSAEIGNGIRAHCWTVSAPAAASYFLNAGALTNPNLYLTWELRSPTNGYHCAAANACTVTDAGTYVLVLQSGSVTMTADDVGTGTVGLWRLDRPVGCESVGTSFAAAAVESQIATKLEADCHQFRGSAGEQVFVHAVPFNYNPLHQIYDSTGAFVCFVFDSTCTLTGTGPYRVVTYTFANSTDPTPSYRLRISSLTRAAGCSPLAVTPFGHAPSRVIDESDPIDMRCYQLARPAGGRIGTEIVDAAAPTFNIRVDVYSPSLQRICSLSTNLGTCVTPTAGTYLIVVHSADGFAGRIGVFDYASAVGCVPGPTLAFGTAPTAGQIAKAGAIACLTVPLVTGDRARLNFGPTAPDVTFAASLVDDAGQVVCGVENDFLEPSDCRVKGPVAGSARILVSIVTFASTAQVGAFSLHAWRLDDPTGCEDIGSLRTGFGPLVGTLADSQDEACYTARARVGSLAVTTSNDNSPTRVPTAEFLRASGVVACRVTGSGTCGLTLNGGYTIVVRRQFLGKPFFGHYRVSGDCTSETCGP